ncbi:transposase-like protein [Bradyrhizobium diazoefficiens]
MNDGNAMGQVIQIDEARIRDHLGEMVRGTVEETLNAMLEAEADQLCGAGRYERSPARQDTRAGSYERTLQTKAGDVNLKVPKLRRQTFETAIIERYRRRESSVEEALIEMYLAGISVRRVEDITEALWGPRVSPSTVSNLNKKIYTKIEAWRNRRIEGEHPYLYLDGIVMKRSWAGEVRNVSLLVASAVNAEGFREILGICEGAKEDKSGLVLVSAASRRSRSQGRAVGGFRCVPRSCRKRCGLSAGGPLSTLHGAFLSQCLQPRAVDPGPRGEPHAQGHSCPGEPRRGRRESQDRHRGSAGKPYGQSC